MSSCPISFRGKRGLFDIEDFFSFLIYILILFMFLIILSIPKCSLRPEQKLSSDLEKADRLNSEQHLVEMLRTQLPANLPVFVEQQKEVKVGGRFKLYNGISYDRAVAVLKGNPQLYRGLTYAEFVDGLGFLGESKDAKNDVFAAVTRAVFVSDIYPPHARERDSAVQFFNYPEVYVKYGVAGGFDSAYDSDLSNVPVLPLDYSGEAVAFIPLTDRSASPPIASVLLVINRNVLSGISEGEVG